MFRVMEVVDVTVELPIASSPWSACSEAEPPARGSDHPDRPGRGVALAHALGKVATPRPLTHELFADRAGAASRSTSWPSA